MLDTPMTTAISRLISTGTTEEALLAAVARRQVVSERRAPLWE
jgi:hypothetical protein